MEKEKQYFKKVTPKNDSKIVFNLNFTNINITTIKLLIIILIML